MNSPTARRRDCSPKKIIRSRHSLLDRQNKPLDVSVQIWRTVGQPNHVSSGVLDRGPELRCELLVAVQDEESLAEKKAVDRIGEVASDLHHERAVRPGSDSSNVDFSRRDFDHDEDVVGHEPAERGDLDGEEVGGSHGFPMGGQKRPPRRPLTSLRCGLDAVFSQNIRDGGTSNRVAEIGEGAANARIPPLRIRLRDAHGKLGNLDHHSWAPGLFPPLRFRPTSAQ